MSPSHVPVPLRLILLTDDPVDVNDGQFWYDFLNRFCMDVYHRLPNMQMIEDVINISMKMEDKVRAVHLFREASSTEESDVYFVYLSTPENIKAISRDLVREFTRWNSIPFKAKTPLNMPEELNMWVWYHLNEVGCKPNRVLIKDDYLLYRAHGGQENLNFRKFFLDRRRLAVLKAVK